MRKATKPFNYKYAKLEDNRISICGPCNKGIFKGQEHKWSNQGLIHTKCGDDESKDAA